MNGQDNSAPTPALSVVMSLCDTATPVPAPQVDRAIRAIRAQSFADFEFLILVDGASLDTARVILGHALDDRRIRMITADDYTGLAGLNLLHEVARAPYIARADAGDLSLTDRFERQMAILADNPGHGVIGTGCVRLSPRTAALAPHPQGHGLVRRDPANPLAHLAASDAGQDDLDLDDLTLANPEQLLQPLGDARLRGSLEAGPPMDCATLIYARAAVLAAGGYREALGHAAGYDLLLRLSSHTRMAKLPDALVSRNPQHQSPQATDAESQIVARARQNAIAWMCHRERLAGRMDPVDLLGRLPSETELDSLFGPGASDVLRRRVIEASLHAPGALADAGWNMLHSYARRHPEDSRMWRLAARMLVAGKPVRAGQLGMALMNN